MSEKYYNKTFMSINKDPPCSSKVIEGTQIDVNIQGSSTLSFVSDDAPINHVDPYTEGRESVANSLRFPVTERERRNYSVVCTLASSGKYSK